MESIFVVTYNHATGEFQVDDSLADANFSDGVWHKEGEGFTKDLSGEENQTDVVAGTLLKSLIQEQNKIKPGFARKGMLTP